MQAQLWMSGRCFECDIERIEHTPDGSVVRTAARRYFRFDAAGGALLRMLAGLQSLDPANPAHANAAVFLQKKLVPLGIYRPRDAEPAPVKSGTGGMRWHRELLAARHVRPLAAALSPLFSPWALLAVVALCLWFHAAYAPGTLAEIGYRDLLRYTPGELLLLVGVSILRCLLHEFGHAAACYRLTGSVGAIGCGVFITTPVLYCDVSDVHFLPRRAKALVGVAGTVMDLVFLALLAAAAGAHPAVMKIYWLGVVAVLLNLLPFYRNDGYWIMNDLAASDDLLQRSWNAWRTGTARTADRALLGFMASCLAVALWLALAFAWRFGPEQAAEAVVLLPQFAGFVLAIVTALQYAALAFGAFAAARLLARACAATAVR